MARVAAAETAQVENGQEGQYKIAEWRRERGDIKHVVWTVLGIFLAAFILFCYFVFGHPTAAVDRDGATTEKIAPSCEHF